MIRNINQLKNGLNRNKFCFIYKLQDCKFAYIHKIRK